MTVLPIGPTPPDGLPDASSYSRYVQRIRRRYAEQMPLLAPGEPLRPAMQATLDALLAGGLDTGAALRVLRQLVLERLVVLDCNDVAPTLPTSCGSLPPEGVAAPAVWRSPSRGPCWLGSSASTLVASRAARPLLVCACLLH